MSVRRAVDRTVDRSFALRPSALVSRAAQHAALSAVGELREVRARDRFEGYTEIAGQDRHVPEHVTELLHEGVAVGLGELRTGSPTIVAHELAELLGHLAGLTGELQRGIEEPGVVGVAGGAQGAVLVLVEGHGPRVSGTEAVSVPTARASRVRHGGGVKPSQRVRAALVGLLVLVAGALAPRAAVYAQTPPEPRYDPVVADLLGDPAGRALLEAYRLLTRDYLGEADSAILLDAALRALVDAVDDPYVTYLDAEAAALVAEARRDPNVIVTAALGDLGYLRVLSFDSDRAGERFSTELDALIVRGARAVVLDLRGNDGGFILTGLQVLDRFLADVVLGYRRDGQGVLPLGFANPRASSLPLAVLVDADTASTAEIVAGALQSYGRGRLYGAVTAGKGVGQASVQLSDGGVLRLVTFEWLLPDRRSVDGWGLTPDVPVRARAEATTIDDLVEVVMRPEVDPVLAAALAGLRAELGDDLDGEGVGPRFGEDAAPDVGP